jgi:hypothetical protein
MGAALTSGVSWLGPDGRGGDARRGTRVSPSSWVVGGGSTTGGFPGRAVKEVHVYRGSRPLLPLATRPSVFPFRGAVGDVYQTTVASKFQWMNLGNSQVNGVEITNAVLVTKNTVVPVGRVQASRRWNGTAERRTTQLSMAVLEVAKGRKRRAHDLAGPDASLPRGARARALRVVRAIDKVSESGMVWLTHLVARHGHGTPLRWADPLVLCNWRTTAGAG